MNYIPGDNKVIVQRVEDANFDQRVEAGANVLKCVIVSIRQETTKFFDGNIGIQKFGVSEFHPTNVFLEPGNVVLIGLDSSKNFFRVDGSVFYIIDRSEILAILKKESD